MDHGRIGIFNIAARVPGVNCVGGRIASLDELLVWRPVDSI